MKKFICLFDCNGAHTLLSFRQKLLPCVMNSLNDCSVEATGRQQIGQRTAMSKWIDREARGRCVIQIVFEPLMSLDQLVDHCIDMNVCLVRHHPATSCDLKSSRLDEMLQRSLLGWMCLIPPQLQYTDFGPNERHVRVLLHSRDHKVQYLPRIALKIVQKRFQPTGVVVRKWNNKHLQRIILLDSKKLETIKWKIKFFTFKFGFVVFFLNCS